MLDFIAKAALETTVGGHDLHVEGFGIYRTFTEHFNGSAVVAGSNDDAHAFGYGGSINLQVVPKLLDVQFSGIGGRGIGRYGSAGLPDVTFDKEGNIHPLDEFMLLGGATLHATPMLDLYVFAGEEQEYQKLLDGGTAGLGLSTANNMDCLVEGGANCAGNTRRIRQVTGGFWQKIYSGSFGRAQVGLQYSYTQRQLFSGIGGAPQAHTSMGFLSFRYYPFCSAAAPPWPPGRGGAGRRIWEDEPAGSAPTPPLEGAQGAALSGLVRLPDIVWYGRVPIQARYPP